VAETICHWRALESAVHETTGRRNGEVSSNDNTSCSWQGCLFYLYSAARSRNWAFDKDGSEKKKKERKPKRKRQLWAMAKEGLVASPIKGVIDSANDGDADSEASDVYGDELPSVVRDTSSSTDGEAGDSQVDGDDGGRVRTPPPKNPGDALLWMVERYCKQARTLHEDSFTAPSPRIGFANATGSWEDTTVRLGLHEASVDGVVTSPPYPGVYDYMSTARRTRSETASLPMLAMTSSDKAGQMRHDVSELDSHAYATVHVPEGQSRDWPAEWNGASELGSHKAYAKLGREAFLREWDEGQRYPLSCVYISSSYLSNWLTCFLSI
jgi:hypothetical protein